MAVPPATLLALLGLSGLLEPAWARCPSQCRCEAAGSDCSHSQLTVVPISLDPRIHYLQLQENGISSISDALMFYPELRRLDLSNNSLPSLLRGQFIMQRHLLKLDARDNMLETLTADTFDGLGRLTELGLGGNQLLELEDDVFKWTESLTRLDLSRNRIKTIARDSFQGLGVLTWLDLSENALTHVPSDAFRHLSALQTLRLRENQLREVPFHAFYVLPSLEDLSLADNRVHRIHPEALSGLTSLRRLDISGNSLDKFPATSLALPALQELDVGGNHFTTLQARHLAGLRTLRVFRACGSTSLASVSPHVFSDSPLLEELHLCDNPQLTWLPSTALEMLPRLRVLDLSGNSLGQLENMTSLLQQVQVFNVSGNPLVCNCSALWLWQLPQRVPHLPDVPAVRCVDSGRPLASLSESDLGCQRWLTLLLVALVACALVFCAVLAALLLLRRRRRRDRQRACVRDARAYADQWDDKWEVKWEDLEAEEDLSASHMITHVGPEYGSLRRLEHFTFRSPDCQKKIPVTVV